jgi:translocation and assembly module TamB
VPIQAAGGIRLLAGDWRAESFEVRSGRSRVLANGNPRDDRGLDLEITALDLALLPLEISGLVNGRMFLQLAEDRIEHRIDLDASGIAYGGLAADTLHIRPRDDGGLNLDAVGVRRGDGDPANLSVQLKGHALGSDVDLQAHTEGLSLQAELRGKLSGWQDPGQVRWDGNLSRMSLLPANHPGLHLQQAAPLKLSAQSISISSACVTGVGDSVLCLESEWNAAGHFNGRADLHEFSLDSIAWLPERAFQMTQVANGTLELGWRNGQSLTGQGRVNLSPGLVHLAEDEELVIRTGEGVIRFAIRDDSLLDGQIDLELPGNGLIDIDFSLPDVVNAPLDDVNGRVRVQLADVGAIWRLAPIFDTLDGALDLDLEVTGGLGQPNIAGQVSFTDGLFVHEASGLTLGQINLAGNLNNQQLSRISGTFQAGEGRGDIDLELDLADMTSAGMVIHLKGEKLTLIDVPSLKLVANPDLGARFEEGLIQVDGRIYVPETVISPTRLPSEAATESDDVRIVAGQPSVRSPDAEPMEEFAITGTVELELGPGVRLDIDVAELGLSGKTRFTWEGRKVPTANGQFNLAGEILAFGQRLEVTSGRIGFPDVPADNPHLNIRAERQIWGNPQVQRAGLMITGTLNQMVSEPYTVPLTTRERAQTLLVTGSDFDYDQGVGAVSAGMYVLPRLYLSYGIGVFERGNVISARYDISERFGVKATSGEKDTGMDITYTIEK